MAEKPKLGPLRTGGKQRRSVKEEVALIAQEHGVPHLEALGIADRLGMGDLPIPPELYGAVAEVMAFIYQIDQLGPEAFPKRRRR